MGLGINMIKFIVCSDSDIPREHIEKYDIDMLPLIVELDNVAYRAYRDITGDSFRRLLQKSKSFPKTATVSIMEIADKMRAHIENDDEIIMVTMSGKGSGTFNSAQIAKAQLEDELGRTLPISVVDSTTFSIAYLHPVYDAVEMAKYCHSRQEIVDFLNTAYAKQQIVIIMADLAYLRRGGRINYSSSVIGGVLGIVSILGVHDGMLEPIGKERGMTRAIDSILRIMEERCPSKKLRRVQLVHWNREEESKRIESLMKSRFTVEEFLPAVNPEASVTAHAGVDFLGISFTEASEM